MKHTINFSTVIVLKHTYMYTQEDTCAYTYTKQYTYATVFFTIASSNHIELNVAAT